MYSIKKIVTFFFLFSSLYVQNTQAGFFDSLNENLNSAFSASAVTNSSNQQNSKSTNNGVVDVQVALSQKTLNLRSGPGTEYDKAGQLMPGQEGIIVQEKGEWLQIDLDGLIAWVYKPLVIVTEKKIPVDQHRQARGHGSVYLVGYAKDFQPVKAMYSSGKLMDVGKFFEEREKAFMEKEKIEGSIWDARKELGLLRWLERSTLFLDQGNLENSIKSLDNAEFILDSRKQTSSLEDMLTWGTGSVLETVSGNEEFIEYPGEPFENILMLNYKSIAFLLNGDRKSYNVARRAIDLQNIEKQKFEKEVREAKEKLSKEKSENKSKTEEVSGGSLGDDSWQKSYSQYDSIADRVPSAYVNPFGFYVTGMVQDFESRKDKSLYSNAQISYKKALELNPNSKALKKVVNEVSSRKLNGDNRLVHVVVSDGFVPEKKVLEYNFNVNNQMFPIKMSLYEPVASKVHKVEIQTSSGERLASLDSIADIEAITLRYQKDTEVFRQLRVFRSLIRTVGVNSLTSNIPLFGQVLGKSLNDMAAPDSRSWMSLPSDIKAARLLVSKNTSTLKLVSYDKKGHVLAKKTLKLNKEADNFVYARTIDNQMYINVSDKLWTM
jgi:uncharacterized protein YraI